MVLSVVLLALLIMNFTGMVQIPTINFHQIPPPVEEIVCEQTEEPDELRERDLLARLIHAEARGESLIGQVAVGAVVMNRVADRRFPDTIGEVIYQPRQFCPVSRGTLPRVPGESSREAARRALEGEDPTGGGYLFLSPPAGGGQMDPGPTCYQGDRGAPVCPVITVAKIDV